MFLSQLRLFFVLLHNQRIINWSFTSHHTLPFLRLKSVPSRIYCDDVFLQVALEEKEIGSGEDNVV